MQSVKRGLSIRNIAILTFTAAMLISIGAIGFLVFSAWINSATQTMRALADDLNAGVRQHIDAFMNSSESINRYYGNLLANGTPDLADDVARDRFFASTLGTHSNEIFSLGFCTVDGAFYGAKRAADGEIRILRKDESTGGILRPYATRDDFTSGEALKGGHAQDMRSFAWYKAAVETGASAFSPIHVDYAANQLLVSASRPICDRAGNLRGVLVADVLLSDLDARLREAMGDSGGSAFVVERGTGLLVANSLGLGNFSISTQGTLDRFTLRALDVPGTAEAFSQFEADPRTEILTRSGNQKLHVNAQDYSRAGLDWVILTVIPESILTAEVHRNIRLAALMVAAALALSLAAYFGIMKRLLMPVNSLLKAAEGIAAGSLSERAPVVRNDEIGRISVSFNRMADRLQYLIANLESIVQSKTADLEASKNRLRLLLDSTAEAIFGVDTEGVCTFCNQSCLKLLGYSNENDLLGRNMHETIHHTRADGSPISASECAITRSLLQGVGKNADDEVFWRADGTWFYVEYHAYPQMQDGAVIGGVITFMDITHRRKNDEEIRFLSSHDVLTGLYNRGCFQEMLKSVDIPENLPLSVIFADLNGLKMTNDIFGHAAGDALILKASQILAESCREADMVSRVGGDEFVILLPRTDAEGASKVIDRIRSGFAGVRIAAVKCSISLGSDTKTSAETSLEETVSNAENAMYKDKTLNRKSTNRGMIDAIMEALHEKSPKEKHHSIGVSALCGRIAEAMRLPEADVKKLRAAGYLHDIGKITLEEHVLHWDGLAEAEREKIQQHSAVGYRILNLFDETLDLAEGVLSHHERWDGTGYPKGLKGNDIPLISRIISVAETYERVSSGADSKEVSGKEAALKVIREGAGKQFDPQIANLLIQLIEAEGQRQLGLAKAEE